MNIKQMFNKLKKLFNKDQNLTSTLARPESTVKLPSRKEFKNDNLVDFYKNEYLNSLNKMKDFDVLVLEATVLNDHMKMAIDLLFAIAISEDDPHENSLEHQVQHLINYEKLKLYLQDIFALQNETIARLIALSEIKKESFIISKRKKDAISSAINRLYISLNTLMGNELAIVNNIQRYGKENIDFNDDMQAIIAQKIKHLIWLQQALPDDKQVIIDQDNILGSLALIEKALEEYTYTCKEEVSPEAKQKLVDEILALPFDMEHKEEILGMVNKLESKYRAFYEYKTSPIYGDVPIDETDLTIFYAIKFNALLISENGIINESFTDLDPIEKEYYQNIIYKTYEDIIMGRNENFNWLFRADFAKAISLIKSIFSNNLSSVLNNFILLNLLFAFDNVNGLFNLFKCKVSSSNLPPDYYHNHEVFEIEDDISLETLCYLESAIDESKDNTDEYFIFTRKNLYELYKLNLKNYPSQDDAYCMPEGIISIKIPMKESWRKLPLAQRALLDKIRKDGKNKIVYFPHSLEKLDDNLFIDVPIKGIVFNEGLKYISNASWLTNLKTLVIPSTLENLYITAYRVSYTERIIFNISQDHAPVLSEDFVLKLFNYFQTCGWKLNEEKNKIMPPDELKEIIIHLNEIDRTIHIDLQKLSFDYDAEKDGSNINEVYIRKLIKYVYYILNQVRKRYDLMQKALPIEERIEITPNIPGFLKDLEIIDKRLQNYRGEHISELDDIKAKLQMPENKMEDFTFIANDFAENLAPLESKIRLFNYYGKNVSSFLDDSLVNYFYKLKFFYLTKDDVVYPFISDHMDDVEINSYERIIEDIYYHLKNNSPFADEQYSDDTITAIKSLIEKILKNGKDNINSEEILHDFYLLNIFLALSDFNRLLVFAKALKVNANNYQSSSIILEEYVSLCTICLLKYYESQEFKASLAYGDFKVSHDFLELFNMIYVNYEGVNHEDVADSAKSPRSYYYLPEGIKSINAPSELTSEKNYGTIWEGLSKDCEGKNIIMPSSLKSLKGIFLKGTCKSINLNEGMQELELSIFEKSESSTITIPSTVKKVNTTIVFADKKFSAIIFNNFDFANEEVLNCILYFFLRFKNSPSEKIQGILPFKLVFHYDELNEDLILGPYFEEPSLGVYSFVNEFQMMKKAIEDIKEKINQARTEVRKRTE